MSATRLAKTAIKIPKYIERKPTDILKALASTVNYLPKEPEYMLHDDPFLLPRKFPEKRNFILARLAGRKTAKFFLNKYPELFFRDDAEPKVEAFCPMEDFNSEMSFTEEDLKWCIDNNDPTNGIIAYESLVAKNIKLSDECLLQFFEMICFTNEENLTEWLEYERSRFVEPDGLVNQTWRKTGLASKIFNQIKEDLDPSRVYSAMISGLSKYNEHSTAKQVFEDFKDIHPDKGLYLSAYDGLLRSLPALHSSFSTITEAINNIVHHMGTHLVKPDIKIFNSLLACHVQYGMDDEACKQCFRLLNDMRSLDIKPSLATFTPLMKIVTKFNRGRTYADLTLDILTYIETHEETLQIRDDRDVDFLVNAMYLVSTKYNSLTLAKRLHKLYLAQPHLFANVKSKTKYMYNYFRLILTADNLENILQFYEDYVPLTFKPGGELYDLFADALDLYNAPEDVIKKIGQDIVDNGLQDKLKNDAIFRKDPNYVEAFEKQIASGRMYN